MGLGLEDGPGEVGACIGAAQEGGQRLHVGCGRRGGIGLEQGHLVRVGVRVGVRVRIGVRVGVRATARG